MKFVQWTVLVVSGLAWSAPNVAPSAGLMSSRCDAGEKLLASCLEKAKSSGDVLLLCGSKNLTQTSGTAQFRLGIIGKRPTVRWPEVPVHPTQFIKVTRERGGTMLELPNGGEIFQQITTVELTVSTPTVVATVSTVETFSGGAESWFEYSGSLRMSGMSRKFECSKGDVASELLELVPVVETEPPPADDSGPKQDP